MGANISLHSVAPGAPTVGAAGVYVGGVLQTGLGGMGPAFAGQEDVAAYKDEGVYVAGVFTAERVGVRYLRMYVCMHVTPHHHHHTYTPTPPKVCRYVCMYCVRMYV